MAHNYTAIHQNEEIDLDETDSLLFFLFYAISLLLTSLLFIWHTYKVISDLCTKNRISVSHRRLPPPLTPQYKSINLFAHLFLFLSMTYLLVCTVQMSDSNYEDCIITTYFWTYPWLLSKACMYGVFLLRLDMVYAHSAYGYSKFFLYGIIALVFISSTTLGTILIFSIDESLFLTDSDEFPNPCFVYYPFWGYTLFLIYDFIANILCLILFIIPLYRATKSMKKEFVSPSHSKTRRKLIYVGIKCMILTTTCVLTTVITLSLLSTGYVGWMCAVDVAVNCVCVLLMTPYYPDNEYYERLCFICLYKCPEKYRNGKYKATPISYVSTTRVGKMDKDQDSASIADDDDKAECKGLTDVNEGQAGQSNTEKDVE